MSPPLLSANLSNYNNSNNSNSERSERDNGPAKAPPSTSKAALIPEPLDYTRYEDRLKSFANWPNKEVPKESLAKAGFYYRNKDDVVQCPFCHIEGYQWVAGDDPMADHRLWSPTCPFVMTSLSLDDSNSTSGTSRRNTDTCGLYGVEILSHSVPEDQSGGKFDLDRLGIQKNKGPTYADLFDCDARVKTFASWPKSIKQKPQDLAEAGFFYVGVGDQCLCFHCGGGLKDWEESDNPWEEHALWFPKCSYVYLKKGPDYIKEVKEKRDHKKPPQEEAGKETKETAGAAATTTASQLSDPREDRDEKTLCKICYKNEVGIVFLPCGHIVACVDCAAALKACAVCRKPLEATVRAFLS